MITINDNSTQQINAALLRLNNVIDMDVDKLESDISKASSKLKQEIDEVKAGIMVYKPGEHIEITNKGVISVIDVDKTLTIQKNGVPLGSFTALGLNSATVNIEVPDPQMYESFFVCTTTYGTAAKTANSSQVGEGFAPVDGVCYMVYMKSGNGGGGSAARTLSLNGSTAYPMYLGEHVAAITGTFQMDSMLVFCIFHAATSTATSTVEAYYQVRPVAFRTMNAYQLAGNTITVENTQYGFNKNFSFELTCQTGTTSTVTLMNWAGGTTTASVIINGNATAGIPNGFRGLAFFKYDTTNGNKLYITSDLTNLFGMSIDVNSNAGTIPIVLRNTLTTYGSQYCNETGMRYGINMNNSDIVNLNGLYTNDAAGSFSEGINFYRRSQTVDSVAHIYDDSMYAAGGHFYFGADVERIYTKGASTSGTDNSDAILHAASFVGTAYYSPNFTYVVDSDAALKAWSNNTAGNDYTSVLIRKGEWTLNFTTQTASNLYAINLTTTGTKVIVGEVGSRIVIQRTAPATSNYRRLYSLYYSSTPTSDDYFIHNLTLGCTLTTTISGSSQWAACYGLDNCRNVSNCKVVATVNELSAAAGNCYAISNCINVHQSLATSVGNATSLAGTVYGIGGCVGVEECTANAMSNYTDQTNTNDYSNNKSVRYCKATNGKYQTSYFSPSATSTYLCANTLNGGWNT